MSTMDDIENDGSDDADENEDGEIATTDDKRRDIFSPFDNSDHISTCSPPCSERTSCGNCTHGLCMWCKNLEMCIERNAYLVIQMSMECYYLGLGGLLQVFIVALYHDSSTSPFQGLFLFLLILSTSNFYTATWQHNSQL